MQDNALTPLPLADGEYRFTLPSEGYRAAQRMSAIVTEGRLTAWAYVNADGTLTPAADTDTLTWYGNHLLTVLVHEVSEAQRLAGLVYPVQFIPTATLRASA